MSMKFGLLIDFDLLKAAISTNAKPEIVLLRFGRQDGVRGRSMLFPVSHLLISLPSEGQSLLANQILSTYINWWLRYNYFLFLKNKRPPYWKSTFGFDFDHVPEICTLFCIRLPNFVQIEAPTAEIWRHIHFWRWRPRRLNTTSGFVSVDVTAFRRSKCIIRPIFFEISQMDAEIFLWQSKMAWEKVNFLKIKNVSISWDARLYFMNTKIYFWCL